MTQITIRPITADEFEQADNLVELLAEYAVESAIPGLGEINVQFDTYRQMEAAGVLHTLGAFRGNTMVGFLSFLVSVLPHYGALTATSESFFVAQNERAGGTGLRLLKAAQAQAKELGAVGLLVSAPAGGRLAQVLPRLGFEQTNEVYFKGLQ